ncbi:DUF2384 domain-containing protein [Myxococcota bacterium]|nr:DUF2384 domain-containing protein [Myxococcota bacterium]
MHLAQVGEILGGEKTLGLKLHTKMDLVDLGKSGITKAAVAHLARRLSLSLKQLAELLPVTERTLQRYELEQHLNSATSEQVLHIAEVLAKGTEVFEDEEKFLLWLNIPHHVFSRKTPLSLLSSRFGVEMVLDELGRIEFGVYS